MATAKKADLKIKSTNFTGDDGKLIYPRAHYDNLDGKPTSYPPTTHEHTINEVEGLQDVLSNISNTSLFVWNDTGNTVSVPSGIGIDDLPALYDSITGSHIFATSQELLHFYPTSVGLKTLVTGFKWSPSDVVEFHNSGLQIYKPGNFVGQHTVVDANHLVIPAYDLWDYGQGSIGLSIENDTSGYSYSYWKLTKVDETFEGDPKVYESIVRPAINSEGTVTNVSAGTQINGMSMTITNGTTTPTISTAINNDVNFRTAIGAAPTGHTHNTATESAAGFMSAADKTRLDGIETGAQKNVGTDLSISRTATTATIGSSTGTSIAVIRDATTSLAGLMTSTDKSKLDGIDTGAEVNVQSDWNATSGDALILNKPIIPTKTSDLTNDSSYTTKTYVDAGDSVLSGTIDTLGNYVDNGLLTKVDKVSGMGLSTNDFTTTEKNKLAGIATGAQVNVGTNLSQGARSTTTLRIDSSTGNNYTIPAVTTSLAGLMTSTDKTKLNGLSNYEHPAYPAITRTATGVEVLDTLTTDDLGHVTGISTRDLPNASTTADGLMTSTDKSKLNGIATGAQANVQSDWNITNTAHAGFIKNKPTIPAALEKAIQSEAEAGSNDTKYMTPLRVKEVLTKSSTLNLGTEVMDGFVNIGNLSSFGSAISIDGANDVVTMKGDWSLDGSLVGASGSWRQIYGGTSASLSKTGFSTLTLQQTAIYYNRPMMMEIKYGSNSNSYTNQIVTFNLGTDSSTVASKTLPKTVSITDFDGRYFKTISVNIYPSSAGGTNSLRVGHVKTLIGDFAGSSGTLTWTTESSDNINVYIGKIWVMN